MANQPSHEIRLGTVKAAIWCNKTDNGVMHNVTLSRIYRHGNAWKSNDSFGRDDLLLVRKVIDLAHTWIFDQQSATAAQERSEANAG